MLRVLDLFSGIGGFSLGLERTGGFRTVAFCEIDPYCRAVLRKHWSGVPCFEDVRTITAADVGPVDVVCGGFPCQDISLAGGGAGLAGSRSGLWAEQKRLIEDCRPKYTIIENVTALRSRGLDQVLREITALGYDAEWYCIPASALGAEHGRDRLWIVAYPMRQGLSMGCATGTNGAYAPDIAPRLRLALGIAVEGLEHRGDARWRGNVHGIPARVDRIRALGNAVVPQIPEIIGRAILEAEALIAAPMRQYDSLQQPGERP